MPEVRIHANKDICDFCSSEEPRWLFRSRNYMTTDIIPSPTLPPHESVGGWLACHGCAVYVKRNDWNGLLRRVTTAGHMNPGLREAIDVLGDELVLEGLKRLWREFATNRVGGPVEWRART